MTLLTEAKLREGSEGTDRGVGVRPGGGRDFSSWSDITAAGTGSKGVWMVGYSR